MLPAWIVTHSSPFAGTSFAVESAMLGTMEIVMILGVVVLLFGSTKLPQLGKGLGEAIGNFKKAQRDAERETSQTQEIDATPRLDRAERDRLEKEGSHRG
jgi:sec-independent protein translocase protein TatA